MADNKEKFEDLLNLLSMHLVDVSINKSVEGVVLPPHVMSKEEEYARVHISTRFNGEINLKKDRVIVDLSFNKQVFTCEIPYKAIFSMIAKESDRTELSQRELLDEGFACIYEEDAPPSVQEMFMIIESMRYDDDDDGSEEIPQ